MSSPDARPDGPAAATPTPPSLPAVLTDPRPVIAVIAVAFALATVAAFTVPSLESWRPNSLAGLGLTVVGAAIFAWQRSAARRGRRGAQSGL